MSQSAQDKLLSKVDAGLHICVGLDSDINKIPEHLKNFSNPILEFNRLIIDATKEYASAYKINFAFYEKFGTQGWDILKKTIQLIPSDILIIADAKRGDIGNTSRMYAESVFDELKADAITLNPYMGRDSIAPFINYKNKLNFILALTSNSSAEDFEKQVLHDGKFLYQSVIDKVKEWNTKENCGIVFGATQLSELESNMELIDNLPVLLPGVGAQGGSLEDVARIFKRNNKNDFLVNVSRGLIYTNAGLDFQSVVSSALQELNEVIQLTVNSN